MLISNPEQSRETLYISIISPTKTNLNVFKAAFSFLTKKNNDNKTKYDIIASHFLLSLRRGRIARLSAVVC